METLFNHQPLAAVNAIISQNSAEERRAKALQVINTFEKRVHENLNVKQEHRHALIKLYYYLGECEETNGHLTAAISYYEKGRSLADQSYSLQHDNAELYLHLGNCHLELLDFKHARHEIDLYEEHKATAHDRCEEIRKAIARLEDLYENAPMD